MVVFRGADFVGGSEYTMLSNEVSVDVLYIFHT